MASDAWNDGLVSSTLGADSTEDVVIHFNESDGSGTFKIENAGTQRMIIDSTGKTCFGASNPAKRLEIIDDSAAQLRLTQASGTQFVDFQADSSSNLTIDAAGDIKLDAGGGDVEILVGGSSVLKISNSSSDVVFQPQQTDKDIIFKEDGGNEIMRIDSSAERVGIGTTSPDYKVDIRDTEAGLSVRSASTSRAMFQARNGTGIFLAGADCSTGGDIFPGSSAYASAIGSYSNHPLQLATNNSIKMTILADGNVGIGETSPDSKLEVHGEIHATNLDGSAINLTCNAAGQIIRDPSDRRLKKNIKKIKNPLEKVMKLKGITFEWKPEAKMGKGVNYGMIAQEVKKVVPELASTAEDGTMGVRYTNAVALLVEALKEQQEQIVILEKKIKKLEGKKSK